MRFRFLINWLSRRRLWSSSPRKLHSFDSLSFASLLKSGKFSVPSACKIYECTSGEEHCLPPFRLGDCRRQLRDSITFGGTTAPSSTSTLTLSSIAASHSLSHISKTHISIKMMSAYVISLRVNVFLLFFAIYIHMYLFVCM